MKIRHMIAAGLLLGASTAQATPEFNTSTVASWTIEGTDSDWLPIFVPVLAQDSVPAASRYTLQRNRRNGVVVHLTSLSNVLGVGIFFDANGSIHRGFIRTTPSALPAPVTAAPAPVTAAPAPVLVSEPAPTPVFEPIASNGDTPAPSTGSVVDEVAAGGTGPLIGQVPVDAPVVAAPAVDASEVPEPATGMLLLAGLAGGALFARRRRG